jgi:hypothetical protein
VQAVVDGYTRPAGRRMMTADLRALYPRDTAPGDGSRCLHTGSRRQPGPPDVT